MALSDTWLRSVVGKERDKILVKSDRDGLSVRISPKGKVVFQYRYQWGGSSQRVDIGSYPATGLKEARDEAIRLRGEVEANRNPKYVRSEEKRSAVGALTNEELIRQWHTAYCEKNKSGAKEILRTYEIHVFPRLGSRPHDNTTIHDWLELLEPLSKKSASITERVLINTKQAHAWGARRKLINTRPLIEITGKDLDVSKRDGDRVLTDEEIVILFQCLDGSRMSPKFQAFVKLLLLFGCRSGEMLHAKVEHFDFESKVWTTPPENHKMGKKTGRPIRRSITPQAEEMIRGVISMNMGSEFVFTKEGSKEPLKRTSVSSLVYNIMRYAWRRLNFNFEHFSLHDLRRTARTNFSSLTAPHVAEIMLGHKLPGVWQVYDKSDYLDDQMKAYALWWAKVEALVYGEGKVSLLVTK